MARLDLHASAQRNQADLYMSHDHYHYHYHCQLLCAAQPQPFSRPCRTVAAVITIIWLRAEPRTSQAPQWQPRQH